MFNNEDSMDFSSELEFSLDDIIKEVKYAGSEQQLHDIISEVKGISDEDQVDFSGVLSENSSSADDAIYSESIDDIPTPFEDASEFSEASEAPEAPEAAEVHESEVAETGDELSLESVIASVADFDSLSGKATDSVKSDEANSAEKHEEAETPVEEVPEAAAANEIEPESNVFTASDNVASEITDYVISKAEAENEYADGNIDYAAAQEKLEDKQPKRKTKRPETKSFREKIINPLIQFLALVSVKVQQSKLVTNGAPDEEAEDLGTEMPPEKAAKFYGKKVAGIRLRMRLSFVLSIIMSYISLGLPVFGKMQATAVASVVCLIMLLTVMMLGLDIITSGIIALVQRKPNANSLIALSCLLSAIDGFIAAHGSTENGLPFCAVSALTVSFSLMGSMLNCRSNRISLRAAASARKPYIVTAEASVTGDGITLLKSHQSTAGFVRRIEESGPDEIVFGTMSPYIIVVTLILSIIAAFIAKNFSGFMHVFSGMVAAAVPVSILLSFPLPFFVSSKIMIHSGSSIAGWSGLYDIGKGEHIIITDRDLFPKNDVTIEKVRYFPDKDPEQVISYAGSMILASGSAMGPAFSELMSKGKGTILRLDEFSCHESGGLVALINGEEVFCGSAGFMQLMGVRLPDKLSRNDCVYVAASGVLYGIFEMHYVAKREVKEALNSIFRADRHPIFAVRDFNVTPKMISRKFDIPTDGFDFPAFTERYEISAAKPSDISKPSAIVSREGLGALIKLADHGKLLYNIIRVSVLMSAISSVLGMLIMFIKMSAATASVAGLLIYMIIWLVPEIALCFFLIEK